MINELIKLSNELDARGLRKEADYLDALIGKVAHGGNGRVGGSQIGNVIAPARMEIGHYGDNTYGKMNPEEMARFKKRETGQKIDRIYKRIDEFVEERLLSGEDISSDRAITRVNMTVPRFYRSLSSSGIGLSDIESAIRYFERKLNDINPVLSNAISLLGYLNWEKEN